MGGVSDIFGEITKVALNNNKNVILIVDTPYLGQPSNTFIRNGNVSNLCAINKIHLNCSISYSIYANWIRPEIDDYTKLQKKFPRQVTIVNPSKSICNKRRCKTSIDGIPIFADDHHLNYVGSKLLGKKYLDKYGNPLTKIVN